MRNDPCPCGSGKKYKRCCGIVEVFDIAGLRLHDIATVNPHGYACMVVEFADAHTEQELYDMLRGAHPDAPGRQQHLFACSDDRETYRFASPRLVIEFAKLYYPGHPFLVVALPFDWLMLHQRFCSELIYDVSIIGGT